jgi:hypothetical protein
MDVVAEREFWVQVRRWLKIRIRADERMVAAIEQRFGPFRQEKQEQHRPETDVA